MDPNTLSIHFSIRDNDENRIADEGRVVVQKTRNWRDRIPEFRLKIKIFFKGAENDK